MARQITKADASLLRAVMKEAGWDVVTALLADEIDTINAERPAGNSEFETLRNLHTNDGRVQGLKEFFDKLERGATE